MRYAKFLLDVRLLAIVAVMVVYFLAVRPPRKSVQPMYPLSDSFVSQLEKTKVMRGEVKIRSDQLSTWSVLDEGPNH